MDLVSRIKKLPPNSQLAREELGDMADWGHLAENVAHMVDLLSAWLGYEYAAWTADPEEVEAEQRRRRRAGIKPPPRPVIKPVASRPMSLQVAMEQSYIEESLRYQTSGMDVGPRMVDSDQFDAIFGL